MGWKFSAATSSYIARQKLRFKELFVVICGDEVNQMKLKNKIICANHFVFLCSRRKEVK